MTRALLLLSLVSGCVTDDGAPKRAPQPGTNTGDEPEGSGSGGSSSGELTGEGCSPHVYGSWGACVDACSGYCEYLDGLAQCHCGESPACHNVCPCDPGLAAEVGCDGRCDRCYVNELTCYRDGQAVWGCPSCDECECDECVFEPTTCFHRDDAMC